MKKLIFILIITLSINLKAQEGEHFWFIQAGIDPMVASGLDWFSEGERVGAGGFNYIIQAGREYFEEGRLGMKFGAQWEQFKQINYTSYGFFGGITFSAPRIPFTNLYAGHFWYITGEVNLIDRVGIQKSSRIFNSDTYTAWGLGVNLGVRINKPKVWFIKFPCNFEWIFNLKDRPDDRVHYTGGKFDSINDLKASSYFVVSYNF